MGHREWFNGGTAAPVVIVTTTGSDPVVTTVNGTPITGPITGDGIFTVDVELDGVSLIEPFEIKIDGTDPVIGTAGLALSFTVGQTPGRVSRAATDATSGLAGTCQVTTTIDTSTATTGPVPIIARAVDVAGNATTAQIGTYTVTAAYVASGTSPADRRRPTRSRVEQKPDRADQAGSVDVPEQRHRLRAEHRRRADHRHGVEQRKLDDLLQQQ